LILLLVPEEFVIRNFEIVDIASTIKDDCPLSEMTLRDLAAILLRKPVSNKEWVNKLL
jgi:hypothetical protein